MFERTLTREQSRAIDQIAIEQYGIPGMVLMENAGSGVVDVLLDVDPTLSDQGSVLILCGKGNNAGDGFVIARHLEIRGVGVKVVLLAPPTALQGDALRNFSILQHTDIQIIDLSRAGELASALSQAAEGCLWIVDAMLGTGAQGDPREPVATAIAWANGQPLRRLAVDVPSGLDCDTGVPASVTFRAEVTATFVAAKDGFLRGAAGDYLGNLHVVSIGVPPALTDRLMRNA